MDLPFGGGGSIDLKVRNNFEKYVFLIFRPFRDEVAPPISRHFQLKKRAYRNFKPYIYCWSTIDIVLMCQLDRYSLGTISNNLNTFLIVPNFGRVWGGGAQWAKIKVHRTYINLWKWTNLWAKYQLNCNPRSPYQAKWVLILTQLILKSLAFIPYPFFRILPEIDWLCYQWATPAKLVEF